MKSSMKISAAVAATAALAFVAAASAQPGFGMGQGMGAGMGPGMGPGMGGMGGFGQGPGMHGMRPGTGGLDMNVAAAGQLAMLKTRLKLTPTQETAWKGYESAVMQQASATQALREQMQAKWQGSGQPATAPEMAAQHEAMATAQASGWQARSKALKELYGVLTPQQQAIADTGAGSMGRGGWARR